MKSTYRKKIFEKKKKTKQQQITLTAFEGTLKEFKK